METAVPIDSPHHQAFGHWVFESAILLPYIRESNKTVILSERKVFKTLFCRHFGFTDETTAYINDAPIVTSIILNNPIPVGYSEQLTRFFECFSSTIVPDVDFVIMPRQTKENYKINDRPCPLTPHLKHLDLFMYTYRIVHTDEITCLQTQIDLVNSGRSVIVTDGSPALVNGMFCSGKKLYIVRGNALEPQVPQYPMLRLILDEIAKKNTIQFIDGSQICSISP